MTMAAGWMGWLMETVGRGNSQPAISDQSAISGICPLFHQLDEMCVIAHVIRVSQLVHFIAVLHCDSSATVLYLFVDDRCGCSLQSVGLANQSHWSFCCRPSCASC